MSDAVHHLSRTRRNCIFDCPTGWLVRTVTSSVPSPRWLGGAASDWESERVVQLIRSLDSCVFPGSRHDGQVLLRPRVVLGTNVCRLRQKRSLTQEDLAGMAEIDRRHVQRIEAGTANPGIDVLQRVKRSLGCTWADLLREIE